MFERGARYALLMQSSQQKKKGVVAASLGSNMLSYLSGLIYFFCGGGGLGRGSAFVSMTTRLIYHATTELRIGLDSSGPTCTALWVQMVGKRRIRFIDKNHFPTSCWVGERASERANERSGKRAVRSK